MAFLKEGKYCGDFSIHNCKTSKETEGTNKNFLSVPKVIFFDRNILIKKLKQPWLSNLWHFTYTLSTSSRKAVSPRPGTMHNC